MPYFFFLEAGRPLRRCGEGAEAALWDVRHCGEGSTEKVKAWMLHSHDVPAANCLLSASGTV